MTQRVLILHGWNGSDAPHWQAWLAEKLEKEGIVVAFPKLPDRDAPDKAAWIEAAQAEIARFRPDAVVCHSLGCTLWFHLVADHTVEGIKKLLLVAPPYNKLEGYPEIAGFFPVPTPKNLQADRSFLIVSDDDPYLSMKQAGELFRTLDIPAKILQEAGHINTAAGFGPLPAAYEFLVKE
jgi:hypothetical protein